MTPSDYMLPPPIITLDSSSPEEVGAMSPSPVTAQVKTRILYCRKCEGHGEKVILKNHAPSCPYILCTCRSVSRLFIFVWGNKILGRSSLISFTMFGALALTKRRWFVAVSNEVLILSNKRSCNHDNCMNTTDDLLYNCCYMIPCN